MSNKQIYSATYSNVPVFEYVTPEGPIMRRKNDAWINATHILKIAKFPKAKRTRILEKDVQTGVHEKVQGGYGKYQGTYVPLELGVDLAKMFGVFEVLRPIFEFKYIEGKSETPPPAPKHNHASASNIAKRQASLGTAARKSRSTNSMPSEPPRRRGRPRRVPLGEKPNLEHADTTPIDSFGPNIGTFKKSRSSMHIPPSLSRQDTEQDSIQNTSNNMNVKDEDLEPVESEDEEMGEESQALMSVRELFGTPRDSFERIVQLHNHDPYGLSQYHHITSSNDIKDDQIFNEYFSSLLTYFLQDSKSRSNDIPDRILNPPQPLSKIKINQPIDNDGNTIFHWACSMANIAVVEFLLSTFKIDPDLRNHHGETPLMFLVKFSNSFQLKNFSTLLDLLFDSILHVDNTGKTVLHHVALIDNKNKEVFARYYMETLFAKIIEFSDDEGTSAKKELVAKFINHQDADGNTAFHIVAYHLYKKCIKVFISYHRYIDFTLKNLVSYTAEDYLASHNYVLRLDEEIPSESHEINPKLESTQSFDSQLNLSKMAIHLQSTASNSVTEKLTELAYAIDKELSEHDEKTLSLLKILKIFNYERLQSQKKILSLFKLESAVDDVEAAFKQSSPDEFVMDPAKDRLVQNEIQRLANDLSFRFLQNKDELDAKLVEFKKAVTKAHSAKLQHLIAQHVKSSQEAAADGSASENRLDLAATLSQLMLKKNALAEEFFQKSPQVPLFTDEFKENKLSSKSIVSNYPSDDKLHKYCKLISICCGMDFHEAESSIDLIESSLSKHS